MKNLSVYDQALDASIDFSHESELSYWASVLNVRPEVIKTAARACCSNKVTHIAEYLNAGRLKLGKQQQISASC